jgi:hypothetical protein
MDGGNQFELDQINEFGHWVALEIIYLFLSSLKSIQAACKLKSTQASWQCSTGNLACCQSWLDKVGKLSVD